MIYYAHPTSWYGTERETADVERIAAALSGCVLNPNEPQHAGGYAVRGMSYFFEDVLPQCSVCVARSFIDSRVSAGVWAEAAWFARNGRPVYELLDSGIVPFSFIESRRLDVDGTRARIKAGAL